eukprot:CAMPEP_0172664550 /NCGR_PEP_ID=MMETSP1074-20121228/6672_1 /TAXON_ID=2916 /ORGANISM="Ceratium fusus, Strain PA161109" /LENGTH=99 /DNA_ID=CAMNT_0013480725 /DNA_START=1070 /DNA_END=1371 /DNA_ORIENTATION=+
MTKGTKRSSVRDRPADGIPLLLSSGLSVPIEAPTSVAATVAAFAAKAMPQEPSHSSFEDAVAAPPAADSVPVAAAANAASASAGAAAYALAAASQNIVP